MFRGKWGKSKSKKDKDKEQPKKSQPQKPKAQNKGRAQSQGQNQDQNQRPSPNESSVTIELEPTPSPSGHTMQKESSDSDSKSMKPILLKIVIAVIAVTGFALGIVGDTDPDSSSDGVNICYLVLGVLSLICLILSFFSGAVNGDNDEDEEEGRITPARLLEWSEMIGSLLLICAACVLYFTSDSHSHFASVSASGNCLPHSLIVLGAAFLSISALMWGSARDVGEGDAGSEKTEKDIDVLRFAMKSIYTVGLFCAIGTVIPPESEPEPETSTAGATDDDRGHSTYCYWFRVASSILLLLLAIAGFGDMGIKCCKKGSDADADANNENDEGKLGKTFSLLDHNMMMFFKDKDSGDDKQQKFLKTLTAIMETTQALIILCAAGALGAISISSTSCCAYWFQVVGCGLFFLWLVIILVFLCMFVAGAVRRKKDGKTDSSNQENGSDERQGLKNSQSQGHTSTARSYGSLIHKEISVDHSIHDGSR